ncbi:MAG: ABC transporter permease [Actinomycetes bacterium]
MFGSTRVQGEQEARKRGTPQLTRLVASRVSWGVLTLLAVSVLIFWATEVLPGNAAYAVLGHNGSPEQVHNLMVQLHLNRSIPSQYGSWIGGIVQGDLGHSLSDGSSVSSLIAPRLVNSAALALTAGLIGTVLAVLLGVWAAARKDSKLDDAISTMALAITALPEFVVAIVLVILFSTVVFHFLPGVSVLAPGTKPWSAPTLMVLPVTALVVIVSPYILRMTRAAMIEALESDYCEMAQLKGVSRRRLLFMHALPNALPPIIQVVALTFLYLAGGIVIVEVAFAYPGIGQGLVNAVAARDIPVIQAIVLGLAAFYVLVNIAADVAVLLVTPRRRGA